MKRIYCRACNACGLQEVINLGLQPPSNALMSAYDSIQFYPLRLMNCRHCGLMQLDYDVSHAELFHADYPFYSGSVPGTVAKSKAYAEHLTKRLGLNPSDLVLEIGGNDGTLLKQFNTNRLNFELSKGPARAAQEAGIPTHNGRWGIETFLNTQPQLIIANNVLAHDPDLQGFIVGIAKNMAPGGTFTAEFPWALKMIEGTQFDTIYHEHYSYFTIRALLPVFAEYGLNIYDVEELPELHGGSLRIFVAHRGQRQVTKSVNELLHREDSLKNMETLWKFRERAFGIRADFEAFIHDKPIYAYGAAAKGNTFINWLHLTHLDIRAVGDTTPTKIGKSLPGSGIPVVSEQELLAHKPEYVLILPWNWTADIVDRLHCIRGWGGQFITAIPELKVF